VFPCTFKDQLDVCGNNCTPKKGRGELHQQQRTVRGTLPPPPAATHTTQQQNAKQVAKVILFLLRCDIRSKKKHTILIVSGMWIITNLEMICVRRKFGFLLAIGSVLLFLTLYKLSNNSMLQTSPQCEQTKSSTERSENCVCDKAPKKSEKVNYKFNNITSSFDVLAVFVCNILNCQFSTSVTEEMNRCHPSFSIPDFSLSQLLECQQLDFIFLD
jgi:hypothetical protein